MHESLPFFVGFNSIPIIIETMKNFAELSFIVTLLFFSFKVEAQQNRIGRPCLFNNFPASIICTAQQLSIFFDTREGQNIKVNLNNNLSLAGTIEKKILKYNKALETVIIKLPAFNNILFSISKRKDAQENIIYSAHLFDAAYADGYQLKKTGTDNYQLTKISMEKLLPACIL